MELFPEDSPDNPKTLKSGPTPKSFSLDNLTDPAIITELLYRTQVLSDEAYCDLVDDIGARAARLILRAKAVAGDVKAIEVYLRLVKDEKASRKRNTLVPDRAITPPAFEAKERPETSRD